MSLRPRLTTRPASRWRIQPVTFERVRQRHRSAPTGSTPTTTRSSAVTGTRSPARSRHRHLQRRTAQFTFTPGAGPSKARLVHLSDHRRPRRPVDGDGDHHPGGRTRSRSSRPRLPRVDDDGLAGGNPRACTGDLDANAGEEPSSTQASDVHMATSLSTSVATLRGRSALPTMHGTAARSGRKPSTTLVRATR